jgi:hypothetical protein
MNDIGDILGAMMTGLIRARQAADLQTAALAEAYKANPLLEGLSVPRIRIPELTVDIPLIVENQEEGQSATLNDPGVIAKATNERVSKALANNNIKLPAAFQKTFTEQATAKLGELKKSNAALSEELVSRTVQEVFSDTLRKTEIKLGPAERELVVNGIRTESGLQAISKPGLPSRILTNIRTADVKDKTNPMSVVRLKITLSEEGVEWATQASADGSTVRTLVPE